MTTENQKVANARSQSWEATLVEALVRKVHKPQAGAEMITIERDLYDRLVAIAQAVAGLQNYEKLAQEISITKEPDGFKVTFRDKTFGEITTLDRDLTDALRSCRYSRDRAIMRLLE